MPVPDTRQRLLQAAEKLFAQRGFQGVSVREITQAADANLASINYHFGSKAGLIQALIDHHIGSLNEQRLELFEQARASAGDQPLAVETILDIFFRPPVFHFVGSGRAFPGLLARIHHTGDPELVPILLRVFGPLASRFLGELRLALPHLEQRVLWARVNFTVGAMVNALADTETIAQAFAEGDCCNRDPEFLTRQLVDFCASGLRHV